MSGVFLSYSRGDRALAERVLKGLRVLGVQVWWDEDMPGVDWQEELARQINELAAVVVLWTPLSAGSKNVRDEARLGQHTEKLVNVLAGVASPPFPFDRINGLPLDGWTGREPHGGWTRLVTTVEDRMVQIGAARPGELTAALSSREADIRRLGQALVDAEEAYQAAKADEGVSAQAAAEAQAQLAACEDQMRRAAEIAHGPSLLRAAQADLDAAQTARDEAESARKAATTALATASRAFSRARTELDRLFGEAPLGPPRVALSPEPRLEPRAANPATPVHGAAAGARPRSSRNHVLILGVLAIAGATVIGLAVLAVGIVALSSGHNASTTSAQSRLAAATTNAVIAETTNAIDDDSQAPAAPPANDAPAPAAQPAAWLAGRWSGDGDTCDDSPLVISLAGETVSVADKGGSSHGDIQKAGGGVVTVKFADGVWTFALNSDTVTVTPPKGGPVVYTRCDDDE